MAATSAINTPSLPSAETRTYPVAASTTLYAGTLVAFDSSGNIVNAADTAGLRVAGRCEADVDNSAGIAGALNVDVRRGVFRFDNSASAAVDANDKGKLCFVEDNQTVAETSTNSIPAGRVHDVDTDGVWVDTRGPGLPIPAAATVITGAADLAALKTALVTLLQPHGIIV